MFGKLKSLFKKKDKDIVAIVTLEREPRLITVDRVESMCRTLGINAQVAQERSSYIGVTVAGWKYVVFSMPIPYPPFKGIDFRDRRMNQVANDHKGYFCAECMECPPGEDRRASRKLLSKLTASIIDEQSLAIYDWTTARFAVMSDEIAEKLAEGNVDAAVNEYSDSVIAVENGKLDEAIAEAKSRWPEFCQAFDQATDKRSFLVKAAFQWNEEVEHMWIEPTASFPDRIEGILQSKPISMPSPRKGDKVMRPLEEISDWGYLGPNGEPVGMFTMAIIQESMK
jgi:uncharacterized protein YegJ (DUF2314 family)